jgi:hypothetical protein
MIVWRVVICCSLAAIGMAQPANRLYPGAKIDQAATNRARTSASARSDFETTVYTSADSFVQVCAFFRKNGKEYKTVGGGARKLPNGQTLQDAFFLLDGAQNLALSKRWVKIQRPYLGEYGLTRGAVEKNNLREVTAIILVKKK